MRRLLIVLAAVVWLSACSVKQQTLRTLDTTVPAAGIAIVSVAANAGRVSFEPSQDGRIHVHVELVPTRFQFFGIITDSNSVNAAKAAKLSQSTDQGNLKLNVLYPGNGDSHGVGEHWTVDLPSSLHVAVTLAAGDIKVTGIAGGVQADINTGKATLDVPGGSLKIEDDIGKVTATVHSLNYSEATLAAGVGSAALTVDGVPVGKQKKSGAGRAIEWKSGGKDSIDIQVHVGKLSVALLTH
ncbi:MAG: hypothetical protein ACRETQ_06935 [Gammaproteobacteria bacterium]